MIACFLSNISAKYYKNPSMLSRVIAKNVGDVFFETQCISIFALLIAQNPSEFWQISPTANSWWQIADENHVIKLHQLQSKSRKYNNWTQNKN